MTSDDACEIEAIRQLLAACTQAGDARKADAYADCFAPDGVLDLAEGGIGAIEGCEAIRAWMKAPSVFAQEGGTSPGFISHHLTTCHIDLTGPDSAAARTYWMVTSAAGLDHNGFYQDHFRKVDGEWRIARRRPRTLWTSPASVIRSSKVQANVVQASVVQASASEALE